VRCEVVAVGTELLLGQIVDTNSSWIGEQLAAVGIDSLFQTKVGDNAERIESALELALSRSEAVIVCGGLGPTQDDITRDVIADLMGVDLVRDDAIASLIESMFAARARPMPQNNLRQADVPVGASTMEQQPGTAPGLVCPIGEINERGFSAKVIYAVPGVPSEMRQMVAGTVLPDLCRRAGETSVIGSRVLRTWGQSESALAEMLADRIAELDELGHATLAFLASGVEGLKVRITAKGTTGAEVAETLGAEEVVVREIVGDIVFGIDDDTMESVVLGQLVNAGLTLAVAESATGGYIAARLSAAVGAPDAFAGGVVAPTDQALAAMVGLSPGVASTAEEVAVAVRRSLGTVVGLAVIGGEPAVAPASGRRASVTNSVAIVLGDAVEVFSIQVPADTDRLRQYTCISALDRLRRTIRSPSSCN